MDPAQILILVVVVVLTVLLVILGLQVFAILKEFKNTVSKVNKILDAADVISESISTPIASFSTVLTGVKTGVSLLSLFKKKKKSHERKEESYGQES